MLNAIDRLIDGDNDWVATGKVSLDFGTSGIQESKPGYWLFYGDGDPAQVISPIDGDLDHQDWATPSTAYLVDTTNGTLVHADDPEKVVAEETPYVLTYVNGAEEEALSGWKATAVSAALAKRFLSTSGDAIGDIGKLLEGYNDMKMATQFSKRVEALKKMGLSAERKTQLERERDAYLKYIQNDDVRDIVTAGEGG